MAGSALESYYGGRKSVSEKYNPPEPSIKEIQRLYRNHQYDKIENILSDYFSEFPEEELFIKTGPFLAKFSYIIRQSLLKSADEPAITYDILREWDESVKSVLKPMIISKIITSKNKSAVENLNYPDLTIEDIYDGINFLDQFLSTRGGIYHDSYIMNVNNLINLIPDNNISGWSATALMVLLAKIQYEYPFLNLVDRGFRLLPEDEKTIESYGSIGYDILSIYDEAIGREGIRQPYQEPEITFNPVDVLRFYRENDFESIHSGISDIINETPGDSLSGKTNNAEGNIYSLIIPIIDQAITDENKNFISQITVKSHNHTIWMLTRFIYEELIRNSSPVFINSLLSDNLLESTYLTNLYKVVNNMEEMGELNSSTDIQRKNIDRKLSIIINTVDEDFITKEEEKSGIDLMYLLGMSGYHNSVLVLARKGITLNDNNLNDIRREFPEIADDINLIQMSRIKPSKSPVRSPSKSPVRSHSKSPVRSPSKSVFRPTSSSTLGRSQVTYVLNPKTLQRIEVGGPTYRKLVDEGYRLIDGRMRKL